MKPFEHIIIENFLDEKFIENLKKNLLKQEFLKKDSDLFSFKQTYDLNNTDNLTIKKFIEIMTNRGKEIIKTQFNTEVSNKIDIFGNIYERNDYLICHDDKLENRAIAYILYLTTLNENDGGKLRLYNFENNTPKHVEKEYIPKNNTLIMFKVSKNSFHDIEEILTNKKRIAITGWFHNK